MKLKFFTLGLALFGASIAFGTEPLPCEALVPSLVSSDPEPCSPVGCDVSAPAPCAPAETSEIAVPDCVGGICGGTVSSRIVAVESVAAPFSYESDSRIKIRRVARIRSVGRGCCLSRRLRGDRSTRTFETRTETRSASGCASGYCGF